MHWVQRSNNVLYCIVCICIFNCYALLCILYLAAIVLSHMFDIGSEYGPRLIVCQVHLEIVHLRVSSADYMLSYR